jgi:hypothetical protein
VSADFVSGATMAAALVIAVIFFRYWRQTHDRLFLGFALGFAVFSVSRLILAFLDEDDEGRIFVYGLRLLAFLLILAAIVDKNRSRPAPAVPEQNGRPDAAVRRVEAR